MNRTQLLRRLDEAWQSLVVAYAGLSDAHLLQPGVTGRWSVRDIIAHVTTWEQEALKYLPVILAGKRPPRYSTMFGGIDAFNARMTEEKSGLTLSEVLRQRDETHNLLVGFIRRVPENAFAADTPFRRRLRADTYGHYVKHAAAIRRWRGER
jgi:hypothetical protein